VLAATGAGLALSLLAALASGGAASLLGVHQGPGAFYAVVPYLLMLVPALVASAFVIGVIGVGLCRFWRQAGGGFGQLLDARLWLTAAREALTLRWLGGGGGGCYYPDSERASGRRRHLHALVFFGFLAALAATAVAAVYQDLLGWPPPYPLTSAPVLLGSAGGVAMIAGCSWLLALKARSPRTLSARAALDLDTAFLVVLDLAAITGMLTLALRGTRLLGAVLVIHLGVLAALYVTAPYGKFVHGGYRFAALLRDVAERRER
jgi:citrate/tricarballylate utilization protein